VSAAASTLKIQADPGGKLRFNTSTLDAKAGKVTILLSNPSGLSHNVSLEGEGVDEEGKTVGQGGTSRVSATLKPGTYTYYCSVPGHRQGGMQGTLTVK
jgi:plastocyanin